MVLTAVTWNGNHKPIRSWTQHLHYYITTIEKWSNTVDIWLYTLDKALRERNFEILAGFSVERKTCLKRHHIPTARTEHKHKVKQWIFYEKLVDVDVDVLRIRKRNVCFNFLDLSIRHNCENVSLVVKLDLFGGTQKSNDLLYSNNHTQNIRKPLAFKYSS